MTVQEKNIQFDKLQKQADKMSSAICSFSGIMEARIEIAIEDKNYKIANDLLKDLIYIHKEKPLGNSSKLWLKKYEEWREELWKLQANQVPMPL